MAQSNFHNGEEEGWLSERASGNSSGRTWPEGILNALSSHVGFLTLVHIGVRICVPWACKEGLLIGLKVTGCLCLQFTGTAGNQGLSYCDLEL